MAILIDDPNLELAVKQRSAKLAESDAAFVEGAVKDRLKKEAKVEEYIRSGTEMLELCAKCLYSTFFRESVSYAVAEACLARHS